LAHNVLQKQFLGNSFKFPWGFKWDPDKEIDRGLASYLLARGDTLRISFFAGNDDVPLYQKMV
jgi:hypothetical protein